MNWLDLVVLAVVGLRTWFGYRRGFIMQVFELAGLIAGLTLAVRNYDFLQWELARYLTLPDLVLAVLAFALILFGTMLMARLLGSLLTGVFKLPGLGWVNALTGALIGALVALVLISFFLSILHLFALPPVEAALSASLVAPYLEQVTPYIIDLVEGYIPPWGPEELQPVGEPVPNDGRSL